ncbi:hypothetical protein Micbo1qcDRAFT_178318 [Microdochium bolleyi]|uniref:Mid2 domain-containing protein n=1 Tax=Microdochium bolleyi TaxID=196109 RepID=A0A136IT61_9PEZI|nr:hypothetical protein Micbo1qcDRAFT_178318 [Microdochium bolleyi]
MFNLTRLRLETLAALSLVLSSTGNLVAGASGKFLYPDTLDQVFRDGDVIEVKWESTFSSPRLNMWCHETGGNTPQLKYSRLSVPATGTQEYTVDLLDINGCWFHLENKDDDAKCDGLPWKLYNQGRPGDPPSTSSKPAASSTSTGLGTRTSTSASTSTTTEGSTMTVAKTISISSTAGTTLPAPSTVIPGSDAAASAPASDLSPSAKAGWGVGIAAAAVLAVAGLIMLVVARRKQAAAAADLSAGSLSGPKTELSSSSDGGGGGGYGYQAIPGKDGLLVQQHDVSSSAHSTAWHSGGSSPGPQYQQQQQGYMAPPEMASREPAAQEIYTGPMAYEMPATSGQYRG